MIEATGFKSDVENLLANFIDTDSVRFEDFARIYREMNFSLVFYLLEEDELNIFLDCAYSVARSFLHSKYHFQVRVGALYLLFALFSQQPLYGTDRVKIKFTPEMWTEFVELIVEVKDQEHHDTNFVFYQLYTCKAFYLVASSEPIVMNKEQNKVTVGASSQLRECVSLDNYLDPSLLRSLEEAHKRYTDAKAGLSSLLSSNSHPDSVLDTNQLHRCNNNLLSDVANQFTQFSEMIEKMHRENDEKKESTTSSTAEPEAESDCISSAKAVKLRAMTQPVEAPKHFQSIIQHESTSLETSLDALNESLEEQEPEKTSSNYEESLDDSEVPEQDLAKRLFKGSDTFKKGHLSKSVKTRTRSIMSNTISNEDFVEGAISLQNSQQLPYIHKKDKPSKVSKP